MKFPNHIILDIPKLQISTSSEYWAVRFQNTLHARPYSHDNCYLLTTFIGGRLNRHNTSRPYPGNALIRIFPKTRNPISALNTKCDNNLRIWKSKQLWTLFNIFFLRKEKIYTKLKYSRVPQYDIVSGGLAILLCGFLGFLICEKYGFELLDSGEFYMLFMYVVFASFFAKTALRLINESSNVRSLFSCKMLVSFYIDILTLAFYYFKNYLKRLFKNY